VILSYVWLLAISKERRFENTQDVHSNVTAALKVISKEGFMYIYSTVAALVG
jgi:hypothetical protein